MKFLVFIIALAISLDSNSQFRSANPGHYIFEQTDSPLVPIKPTGLRSDPSRNDRIHSPAMFSSSGYDYRMQNNFFWTGNVTTMSYNKGKFGTYFYWDVQGNLRGTKGFVDISGRNKRGLKLTFLWR